MWPPMAFRLSLFLEPIVCFIHGYTVTHIVPTFPLTELVAGRDNVCDMCTVQKNSATESRAQADFSFFISTESWC
jgi:hypothetical protein